jgi:antitoxin HicB
MVTIIMKISYYAILQKDDDGRWVKFPDLEGCFSNGDEGNIEKMAKEAMGLYFDNMEVDSIPSPSSVSDFTLEKHQSAVKIVINVEVRNNRIYIPGVTSLIDEF